MSLKDTYKHLKDLLANITLDLEKSENGNKAASQRVRTGTVKLEKIAKLFRKESIATEKKTKGQKKPSKTAAKKGGATKSKAPAKSASKAGAKAVAHKGSAKGASKTASKSKSAVVKAKPKAKSARASFKSRPLSVKKQTAKLPKKR